ncbi:MAG: SMC-Scp complex subunit ScpB [Candidatus Woesearchaeota archaeon]
MNSDKLIGSVETILFALGRGVTIDQIKTILEKTHKEKVEENEIRNALEILRKFYDQSKGLKLYNNNNVWFLSARDEFTEIIANLTDEVDLTKSVLETLALIAWKAPVLQSEIIEIRNVKGYEHIKILEERGFIKTEKFGNTRLIKLTDKFFDYFDLNPNIDIREMFKMRLRDFEEKLKEKRKQKKDNEIQKEEIKIIQKTEEEKKENYNSQIQQYVPEKKKIELKEENKKKESILEQIQKELELLEERSENANIKKDIETRKKDLNEELPEINDNSEKVWEKYKENIKNETVKELFDDLKEIYIPKDSLNESEIEEDKNSNKKKVKDLEKD